MYEYTTSVTLRDTDSFGLIYFTEQLNYCSEAFQHFLAERGIPLPADPRLAPFVLPVVHCESDFTGPLRLGDPVLVRIDSVVIGNSSITLSYTVHKNAQQVGTAKMVHVCIDPVTGKSITLPDTIKKVVL